MNWHHRRAGFILAVTIVLDVILGTMYGLVDKIGVWHGIYCSTGIATTVGCDVAPVTTAGYVISSMEMLTIVPLFISVFSFITTGLTADHIDQAGGQDQ